MNLKWESSYFLYLTLMMTIHVIKKFTTVFSRSTFLNRSKCTSSSIYLTFVIRQVSLTSHKHGPNKNKIFLCDAYIKIYFSVLNWFSLCQSIHLFIFVCFSEKRCLERTFYSCSYYALCVKT